MLSQLDNDSLTHVGPGTPMGELMRRYWIPAAFTHQVTNRDGQPIRVRLLCEDLVLFRDTEGRFGLLDERCPHRLASLFFGRNEQYGLRCVYHGLKFDVDGRCVDAPCVPNVSAEQMNNLKQALRVKSYPCLERGGMVWTYMGPPEQKPVFPEIEWTMLPETQRFATRHIQECNWLQGVDGGFDATHLSFLHGGAANARKGNTNGNRRVIPSHYEVVTTKCGLVAGAGRELENGNVIWSLSILMVPFHKIIPSRPLAAHVWAPIDDENTMLYSINFDPHRPLTDEDLEREKAWKGIHTENILETDQAVCNKANDYLIDRALQASGMSYTGIKGFGMQDCAIQESIGLIADRTKEHLLVSDAVIVRIRRLLLQMLKDHADGRPLLGTDPHSYRIRAGHHETPAGASLSDTMDLDIRIDAPVLNA